MQIFQNAHKKYEHKSNIMYEERISSNKHKNIQFLGIKFSLSLCYFQHINIKILSM